MYPVMENDCSILVLFLSESLTVSDVSMNATDTSSGRSTFNTATPNDTQVGFMFKFDLAFLKVDELFVSVVEPANLSTPSNTFCFTRSIFPSNKRPNRTENILFLSQFYFHNYDLIMRKS